MPIATTLRFLGGAGSVTGSRFLFESQGERILVDCGLFQEREFASRNWDRFPVPPESITAVVLTHAHLDHCGYLPKLVRDGFHGRVYCTSGTRDIARVVLEDSGRIQEEDAGYKLKRHRREGRTGRYPEAPLYTADDARRVRDLFAPVRYGRSFRASPHITATFRDAGHILGSSTIELRVDLGDPGVRTIIFSGDLGRVGKPLHDDPEKYREADYVVVESTYGDRDHDSHGELGDRLATIVNETAKAGGNLVIPSFSVERAQELLFFLKKLMAKKRIPPLMTFIDSPMATDVTEIYERHPDLLSEDLAGEFLDGDSPFRFPGLSMVRTVTESKAINSIRGTAIIIAGSGMCTGGRIKHHLANNISREESTILFVGYQARGTLGRLIVEGADPVRILGQERVVRARIARLDGFSAHADREGIMTWLSAVRTPPKRTFIVHGEEQGSIALAKSIRERLTWQVEVPHYDQEVVLD